jgi:TRAP-type C4-dicarboxylate transport system permease small subunit
METTEFAGLPASIVLLILILAFPLLLLFVVSRLGRKVKLGPTYEHGPHHNVSNEPKER